LTGSENKPPQTEAQLYLQAKDGGSAEGGNRLGSFTRHGGGFRSAANQAEWAAGNLKKEGERGPASSDHCRAEAPSQCGAIVTATHVRAIE